MKSKEGFIMSEKLEVVNFGGGDVSFDINPLEGKLDFTASHHRRRITKGTVISVKVPRNACVDLVKATGHSHEVLEGCKNLQDLFKFGQLKRLDDMRRESDELNKAIEDFDKVSAEDLADPDEVLVDVVEDNSDLFASDRAKTAVVPEIVDPNEFAKEAQEDLKEDRDAKVEEIVNQPIEVSDEDKDLVVEATGELKVEIPEEIVVPPRGEMVNLPPIIEEPKEEPKPPVKPGRGRPKKGTKKTTKKGKK